MVLDLSPKICNQTSTSNSQDSGNFEAQRVVCTLAASSASTFTLVVRNMQYLIFIVFISPCNDSLSLVQVFGTLTTASITGDMTASQIEETIEYLANVGNVTVSFPNSGVRVLINEQWKVLSTFFSSCGHHCHCL